MMLSKCVEGILLSSAGEATMWTHLFLINANLSVDKIFLIVSFFPVALDSKEVSRLCNLETLMFGGIKMVNNGYKYISKQ